MKRHTHQPAQRRGSLRILIEYEASRVTMVAVEPVATIAPPADTDPVKEGASGFWYELRDENGRTLYRRVIRNPITIAHEVRTGEPDRPFAWKQAREVRGEFHLLVPDLALATTLVLFSSPLEPARAAEPAKELSRFKLSGGRESGGR